MRYARYCLGRYLVHLGLKVMPPGIVRTELYDLFNAWGVRVKDDLDRARIGIEK